MQCGFGVQLFRGSPDRTLATVATCEKCTLPRPGALSCHLCHLGKSPHLSGSQVQSFKEMMASQLLSSSATPPLGKRPNLEIVVCARARTHTHTHTHTQQSRSLNPGLHYCLWREGVRVSPHPGKSKQAASEIQRPANTFLGLVYSPTRGWGLQPRGGGVVMACGGG